MKRKAEIFIGWLILFVTISIIGFTPMVLGGLSIIEALQIMLVIILMISAISILAILLYLAIKLIKGDD
jgi:hypothetical protein